jgi:hypothetical protein
MKIKCFDYNWKKYYRADLHGNIFRLANTINNNLERKLTPHKTKDGYLRVNMHINKKKYIMSVHRLVCMYFIHNFKNKETVEHKNQIKSDNRLFNLCWFSRVEQKAHIVSNCNEKHITKLIDGRFQIQFSINKVRYRKCLKKGHTLEDAINRRNLMYQEV